MEELRLRLRHDEAVLEACGRRVPLPALPPLLAPAVWQEELRWALEDWPLHPDPIMRPRLAAVRDAMAAWQAALAEALLAASPTTFEVGPDGPPLLAVESDNPAILALPFELLLVPAENLLMPKLAGIVRRLPGSAATFTRTPAGRPRVLAVSPRPDLADVPFLVTMERVLDLAAETGVELRLLRPPTFAALERELAAGQAAGRPWDVVLFDGHGEIRTPLTKEAPFAALMFAARPDGTRPTFWRATHVAEALAAAGVRLLLLNACRSGAVGFGERVAAASAATAAAATGLTVLAMSHRVLAGTAARVTTGVLAGLVAGQTILTALETERRALQAERDREAAAGGAEVDDWLVPVLYGDAAFRLALPGAGAVPLRVAPFRPPPGRDDDLRAVERAFLTSPIVLLFGPLGAGKTTLAEAFAELWRRSGGGAGDRLERVALGTAGEIAALQALAAAGPGGLVLAALPPDVAAWPPADRARLGAALRHAAEAGWHVLLEARAPLEWLEAEVPRLGRHLVVGMLLAGLTAPATLVGGSGGSAQEVGELLFTTGAQGWLIRPLARALESRPALQLLMLTEDGDPSWLVEARLDDGDTVGGRIAAALGDIAEEDLHRLRLLALLRGFCGVTLLAAMSDNGTLPAPWAGMTAAEWERLLGLLVDRGLALRTLSTVVTLVPALTAWLEWEWRATPEGKAELAVAERCLVGPLGYMLEHALDTDIAVNPEFVEICQRRPTAEELARLPTLADRLADGRLDLSFAEYHSGMTLLLHGAVTRTLGMLRVQQNWKGLTDLLFTAADALHTAGQEDWALRWHARAQDALRAAAETGDKEAQHGLDRLAMQRWIWTFYTGGADLAAISAFADRVLAEAPETDLGRTHVGTAMLSKADVLSIEGRNAAALELVERVKAAARQAGNRGLLASAFVREGTFRGCLAEIGTARAAFAEGEALLNRATDPDLCVILHFFGADLARLDGDEAEARRHGALMEAAYPNTRPSQVARAIRLLSRARERSFFAAPEIASGLLASGLPAAQRAGSRLATALLALGLADVVSHESEPEAAAQAAEAAVTARMVGDLHLAAHADMLRAWHLRNVAELVAIGEDALTRFPLLALDAFVGVAELKLQAGDAVGAVAALERVEGMVRNAGRLARLRWERLRGHAAAAQGDAEGVERHWRQLFDLGLAEVDHGFARRMAEYLVFSVSLVPAAETAAARLDRILSYHGELLTARACLAALELVTEEQNLPAAIRWLRALGPLRAELEVEERRNVEGWAAQLVAEGHLEAWPWPPETHGANG
jgi:energy-coupling factor transporter ATP-binding protein EcfA2